MKLAEHSPMLAQSRQLSEVGKHLLEQPPRTGDRVAHVRRPSAAEVQIRHPDARRLSIREATSSISLRSSSSASSAATSARSVSLRRSADAASRIDFLIASDRLIPEASSVRSALCTSSSIRTDTAFAIRQAYHVMSYNRKWSVGDSNVIIGIGGGWVTFSPNRRCESPPDKGDATARPH